MEMPWKQPRTKPPAGNAVNDVSTEGLRPAGAGQSPAHCPYSFARARAAGALLVALTLGACATAAPPPEPTAATPAPTSPAAPAPPTGPSKRQALAAAHREKAEAL